MNRFILPLAWALLMAGMGTAVSAQQWHEPARGTQVRRDLMDAMRPIAQWQLGAPVQFVVLDLRLAGDVAFGALNAQRPGGAKINLYETPAYLRGELYPDEIDGAMYTVLYKKSGDMWVAVEWSLGSSDVWWASERICRAFGAVIEDYCVGYN